MTCLEPLREFYSPLVEAIRNWFVRLWYLLSVMCSDPDEYPDIDEKEWIRLAKIFASGLTDFQSPEKATSYLHIFVYHIGFYRSVYGNLDRYANFSIEGTMKWLKKQTKDGSTHFGGKIGMTGTLKQKLEKHNRMQPYFKKVLSEKSEKLYSKSWCHSIKNTTIDKNTIFS